VKAVRAAIAVAVAAAVLGGTAVGWASSITVTSTQLAAAAPASPVMFPVSVTLANKSGSPVGKVNNGDTITVVWSQLIEASTLCGLATNAGGDLKNFKWSISAGGGVNGDDVLAPNGTSGNCPTGLHVGSIDLGAAGYNTKPGTTIDFSKSTTTLTFDATTTTLTVTLNGQGGGSAQTVTSGSPAVWTPDPAVTDRFGRTCGANLAASSSTVQF
jgi:hypothetical protein